MKIFIMTLFLALAASATAARGEVIPAQNGGEFTIQWRQMTSSAERVEPVMTIGNIDVAVRPLPKAKPKDPPKAALFIGDAIQSKTLIHPGKWYHFTLVGTSGKVQLYINGYPDGSDPVAADLSGEIKAAVDRV